MIRKPLFKDTIYLGSRYNVDFFTNSECDTILFHVEGEPTFPVPNLNEAHQELIKEGAFNIILKNSQYIPKDETDLEVIFSIMVGLLPLYAYEFERMTKGFTPSELNLDVEPEQK